MDLSSNSNSTEGVVNGLFAAANRSNSLHIDPLTTQKMLFVNPVNVNTQLNHEHLSNHNRKSEDKYSSSGGAGAAAAAAGDSSDAEEDGFLQELLQEVKKTIDSDEDTNTNVNNNNNNSHSHSRLNSHPRLGGSSKDYLSLHASPFLPPTAEGVADGGFRVVAATIPEDPPAYREPPTSPGLFFVEGGAPAHPHASHPGSAVLRGQPAPPPPPYTATTPASFASHPVGSAAASATHTPYLRPPPSFVEATSGGTPLTRPAVPSGGTSPLGAHYAPPLPDTILLRNAHGVFLLRPTARPAPTPPYTPAGAAAGGSSSAPAGARRSPPRSPLPRYTLPPAAAAAHHFLGAAANSLSLPPPMDGAPPPPQYGARSPSLTAANAGAPPPPPYGAS